VSETVRIGESEREVAIGEVQAVLAVVEDAAFRGELSAVAAAIETGELSPAEQGTLEHLLELGLQAGRIRALYGPGGEQAALRLYRRLPHGAEAGESAEAVNEALSALAGRTLDAIQIRAVGPSAFALTVQAGGAELSIQLDRHGARLASVGV
jgi:hypothetical protein